MIDVRNTNNQCIMICQKSAVDLKILKSVKICLARARNGQLFVLNLSQSSFVFLTDYHTIFSVQNSTEVFYFFLSYQKRFEICTYRKHVNLYYIVCLGKELNIYLV